MANKKVFRFWEADCERYVTKSEHDNWHLWNELEFRLEQEFGHPFKTVPYQRRGDWLAHLWFHPKNTPRPLDDWMNQARLAFSRSTEARKMHFGLEVELPSVQNIEEWGQTKDKDGYRLMALLENDADFCQMIDDLLENGVWISTGYWDGEFRNAHSSSELRDILNSLGTERSWSAYFKRTLACEEAVQLGEQINDRIMDVFRLVWPVWLRVLPPDIRGVLEDTSTPVNVVRESSNGITIDPTAIQSLAAYLADRGFYFPPDLLTTYYLSLQSKPFVILTGISGTGKTKLAQLFAEWMSPQTEYEIEKAMEPALDEDKFTLTVQPYMLKYSRTVIPVDYWGYFPDLGVDEKVRVRVRVGDSEEDCLLGRYASSNNPNRGPIYWLFKGKIREWLKNELQVGDTIEVLCSIDEEEDPVYTLHKPVHTQKQRLRVTRDYGAFISVRPDWTDNRGLLGFYNLITGAYQPTDFLRLLIQAAIDGDRPHFVILDEMNLAKVEYYFADFLSVLESRYVQGGKLEQELLRLHDLPRCVLSQGEQPWDESLDLDAMDQYLCRVRCGACPLRHGLDKSQQMRGESNYDDARKSGFDPMHYIPPRLAVPRNVYFSGTVNVDETTYMFSPKVLDRANTIEFNAVNLERYFTEPASSATQSAPADDAIRAAFTFEGKFVQLPKSLPLRTTPVLAPYRSQLIDLNTRLRPFTLHFGYRVADEILLYLWNAHTLNDPTFDLHTAFDHQIYQKILPKFHGSQAKLQKPLEDLGEFCEDHNYAHSHAKIQQMLTALKKEGFASFA